MNNEVEMDVAKKIMGNNFIGVEELELINDLKFIIPNPLPKIEYSMDVLEEKKNDYLLILGLSTFEDGTPVSIRNFISRFGKNPEICEPCFYNQDWYDKESFIDKQMKDGWFLIRKTVFEGSRAMQPDNLIKKYSFPTAISCIYSFFVTWFSLDVKLWYLDFVWCSDTDHNGDRIYVGKYHDVDGVNKNGFSIHRHLALRPCYGCIDGV